MLSLEIAVTFFWKTVIIVFKTCKLATLLSKITPEKMCRAIKLSVLPKFVYSGKCHVYGNNEKGF